MKTRSMPFEQVVQLRPDYKDGYINVGLTYIEWEKYAEARAPLEKALTLHAGRCARALLPGAGRAPPAALRG